MPMDLRRMLRATRSRAKARQLILRAKALTLVPAVISPGRCRLAAMESSLTANQCSHDFWSLLLLPRLASRDGPGRNG